MSMRDMGAMRCGNTLYSIPPFLFCLVLCQMAELDQPGISVDLARREHFWNDPKNASMCFKLEQISVVEVVTFLMGVLG